ncbi:hypothetical protein G6F21_014119 [Rhizopus arrhizus]|nr:hypothetical protein G6F21_014119 [Rhizopus arrhizus]
MPASSASQPGLASSRRCWKASRPLRRSQPMQRTRSSRPCRSITFWLPARWCRPSTFWVSSTCSLPRLSSAASAWWVPLGRARPKRGQPSRLRAPERWRVAASPMKAW